eukprot:TRINITY_DN1079_c0_g1_i6.p1 TRINITY_DN1079_c0_g1~~TRINITY_DN1079_c0_g1_i6.p1  ORF type:complete len:352 (+),score=88.42 TRINITY_DN1079_c0_g1_i6:24-1058(+)
MATTVAHEQSGLIDGAVLTTAELGMPEAEEASGERQGPGGRVYRCCGRTWTRRSVVALLGGVSAVVAVALFVLIPVLLYYTLPVSYAQKIQAGSIVRRLEHLQDIADEHNGTRDDFSGGYAASVEYVEDQLKDNSHLRLEHDNFTYELFDVVIADCSLALATPHTVPFAYGSEFLVMWYSAPANETTAPISIVTGRGCEEADFASLRAGDIALVPGYVTADRTCTHDLKVQYANSKGAVAVVVYNVEGTDKPTNGYLLDAAPIPALGVTNAIGLLLATIPDAQLSFKVSSANTIIQSQNMYAKTKEGDSKTTVIVGAHLDAIVVRRSNAQSFYKKPLMTKVLNK